ncbi:NADPH-dependent FMN reductase [Streptomyces sp. NPDC096311]|uniref:NADPH-dependent FMN reductase n=1 Tax=Streptomyces sp. NPDC096311 TaxID=3366083 RepID=UPI003819A94B
MSGHVRIVGLGGSSRPGSVSAAALRLALDHATALGAETSMLNVADLDLPPYPVAVASGGRTDDAIRLVKEVRAADGMIVSVPCYHGTIGGQLKNAIDYFEDLAGDAERPYLTGTAMGIVTVASGWIAAVGTVTTVRAVAHAVRAWPTPLAVPITTRMDPVFDADGNCTDPRTDMRLKAMAHEVHEFARMRQALPAVAEQPS